MPGTDGSSDQHGASHGKTYDHNCQHVHQLASDGDSRDGSGSVELSRDEKIRETVKGLQKAGDQEGDREAEKGAENAVLGESVLNYGHNLKTSGPETEDKYSRKEKKTP